MLRQRGEEISDTLAGLSNLQVLFALYSRAPARREAEVLTGPMVDFQPLGKRSPAES